jgi:hypothetical protein
MAHRPHTGRPAKLGQRQRDGEHTHRSESPKQSLLGYMIAPSVQVAGSLSGTTITSRKVDAGEG